MIATPPAPTQTLPQAKSLISNLPISPSPNPPDPQTQSVGGKQPVAKLLAHLQSLDIHLWLEAHRLRYNAPKGAMTPELVAQLGVQKAEIITFLRHSSTPQSPTIPLAPRHASLPLSFAQERIWLLDQLEEGQNAAYNMPAALRLQGALNLPALIASLTELTRRHEILRTTFPAINGAPVQQIAAPTPIHLPVIDLRSLPTNERDSAQQRWITTEATRPFDLASGPLLRVTLLQLTDTAHVLLLTLHHIIADGWSINVMISEISTLYAAFSQHLPSPLADLPIQYVDFADWQRQWLQGDRLTNELAFWKEQLAGAPPLLELPTYQPRPPLQTFRGSRLRFKLDAELTSQLRTLSQQHSATLAMTLLSAFKVLLARYSGQNDIVVGMPIANRNHPAIEPLIGFFLNTLLLRTDLGDNPSFGDLLKRIRQTTVEAYTHQDLPFIKLAEELQPDRTLSYNPLFQVLFLYQGEGSREITIPGLQVTTLDNSIVQIKDDLLLELEEKGGELHGAWEYNLDLFQPLFIERFSAHFANLLRAIVRDPSQPVLQLPMLDLRERRQLLVDWNSTETVLDPNLSFQRLFATQVQQTPNAIAIRYRNEQLTYAQLDARAEQMAQQLIAHGVGTETLVAILAQRSPDFLTTILALFKADAAYLPLDLRSPAARLAQVLQQSGTPLVLATLEFQPILDEALATMPAANRPTILWIDQLLGDEGFARPRANPARLRATPAGTQLAYVIYTSGSTGLPKGAMVEQRGMVNHLFAKVRDLKLTANDVVAQNASQSFDISVWQFLVALTVGGTVQIFPDDVAADPRQLLHECHERGVTILEVVPSLLRMMLEEIKTGNAPDLPQLRWLIPTGEALPPNLARQWLAHFPNIPLLNAYGPTECSDDVTHCPIFVPPGEQVLNMSIGRPIANLRIYILDSHLQPVPIGVAGEIYVGGVGVGRGYIHDPARTAQAFLRNPFSSDPDARLYKTGDKARYLPAPTGGPPNIEYLGRIDFQVKIRGFRIELGEIEATLAKHPTVAQTVVIASDGANNHNGGVKQLIAYFVAHPGTTATSEELRQFTASQLPSYMVPALCVQLDQMPLNNSGKVDRKSLPRPDFAESAVSYVAPSNPIEHELVEIWQRVLQIETIGVESNFFDLGGHSLLATQVIARIRQHFALEMPLRTLFETPTISAIAQNIAQHITQNQPASPRPPILPIERTGDLPLSFAQQRLWFIDQLEGAGTGYVIPGTLRLQGEMDRHALLTSLNNVVQRHESLRTTFVTVDGQPVQRIATTGSVDLPEVDLRHLPDAEKLQRCQELAFAEVARPFALSEGPLLRCTLYQLAEDDFVLLVALHHIIADGWSIGVLSSEVIECYRQQLSGTSPRLPDLAIQVADYADWQRRWLQGQTLQEQLDYWKMELADAPALLELPTDRVRGNMPSFRSDSVSFELSSTLTQQLNQLGQQQGATIYMTLLTAFATLLSRHSGQTDVVIGSPIANRTSQEIEALIGFFVNTLALRVDLHNNPSFVDLLQQVRQTTLDAYAHQDLPFEQVVDALHLPRNMSHTPLFQVLFAWQSANQSALFQAVEGSIAGLAIEVLHWKKPTVEFDLVLSLAEEHECIKGSWEFSCDLFEHSTIERLVAHFYTLLNAIVATPQQSVAQLPILSAQEMATSVVHSPLKSDPALAQQTLHQLFEQQVAQTPQAVALICADQSLTYDALNRQANQLAHHLRSKGIRHGACVGICVERSLAMVVAILGVIKAGAAYLPLDPAYPPERLQFMLDDANVALLLTQSELLATESNLGESNLGAILRGDGLRPTLVLDTTAEILLNQPANNGSVAVDPADPVYIIYTSGTTGNPKGVVVPHRGVVNTVHALSQAIALRTGERFLQFGPFGFDVSAMQIFMTLTSGATLVLDPMATQLSLAELMQLCEDKAITVLDLPVALWQQNVSTLKQLGLHYPDSLRVCMTGGEKPSLTSLNDWAHLSTQPMTLLCSYGPTEASITTTIFVTDNESVRNQPPTLIPLGDPLPNTELHILDANQQPVPLGTVGELYIGGIGLALGYLNQPSLTEEKFVTLRNSQFTTHLRMQDAHLRMRTKQDALRIYRTGDLVRRLSDGNIEFLGRIDSQVKIRGFRIELSEIEAQIKQHPAVDSAVVMAVDFGINDKRLVTYVVRAASPHPNEATQIRVGSPHYELKEFLKSRLPMHMIPSAFVTMETWPLTPNGKLDRKALPPPDLSDEGEMIAPRNTTEAQVAEIWAAVLGIESIGVESNFFDLGGHSLLATQIVSRIRQHFGIDIPLRSLMEEPTIASVARHLIQIEQTLQQLQPAADFAENVEVFEL